MLQKYIKELKDIFRSNERYEAHKKSASILRKMSQDMSLVHEIIKNNLENPEFLKKTRHYPTIAFPIEENNEFGMVMNCFLPVPDRSTNISFQSIHHHGNLLLTTVSCFGPGYESMIFKKDFNIDKDSEFATLTLEKIYLNELNNYEFIDSYTPHIVFYPASLSITLALWSSDKKTKLSEAKNLSLVRKLKKPLLKLAKLLGASSLLNLNVINYFDFYVDKNQIKALKTRIEYPEGDNTNFLQNVFYILQQLKFRDSKFLEDLRHKYKGENKNVVSALIEDILNGKDIQDRFLDIHLNIDKVNIKKEDILNALNAH